jgi:hypothetical protein
MLTATAAMIAVNSTSSIAGSPRWRASQPPATAARRIRPISRMGELDGSTERWYPATLPGRVQPASGSATSRVSELRKAPSRQAMNRTIETTATMIVEIALIWGVTPNLSEL